ncbi:MAG: Fic family protein [Chloroflexota bacterium]
MNVKDFEKFTAGRLLLSPRGYYAFVPNALPKEIKFTGSDMLKLIADAERTLGRLGGIGYLVPNPDFLVIPYTRREAVASSRIEGTQASLSELFYFEAETEKPAPTIDLLEVKNYLAALNHGIALLNTLPLILRLVREVHQQLMTGVRGGTPDKTPGEFRTSQNWIGGSNLKDATYVPPSPEELNHTLGDWEKFLNDRDTNLPLLVQCALLHYQFEAIHPFLDGNGRVGRLMIVLFLIERKALPYPLLYLSDYFERHRQEYYELLLRVSQLGDWESWVRFFLRGVIQQGEDAIGSARRIVDQREAYRRDLQERKASASVLALLDLVFINPYLNVPLATQRLGVSYPTAQAAIRQLEDAKILEEITGQRRNRTYVARQLLHLLDENEPIYTPKKAP